MGAGRRVVRGFNPNPIKSVKSVNIRQRSAFGFVLNRSGSSRRIFVLTTHHEEYNAALTGEALVDPVLREKMPRYLEGRQRMKKSSAKRDTTGKKRVKISKLRASKETVKDLTTGTKRKIQGGGNLGGSGFQGGFSCALRKE